MRVASKYTRRRESKDEDETLPDDMGITTRYLREDTQAVAASLEARLEGEEGYGWLNEISRDKGLDDVPRPSPIANILLKRGGQGLRRRMKPKGTARLAEAKKVMQDGRKVAKIKIEKHDAGQDVEELGYHCYCQSVDRQARSCFGLRNSCVMTRNHESIAKARRKSGEMRVPEPVPKSYDTLDENNIRTGPMRGIWMGRDVSGITQRIIREGHGMWEVYVFSEENKQQKRGILGKRIY
ncbi:hypothetical protein K438DRAFT_1751428 [Mycena galopus ATCC 62051]|nr:hypothetical protein K438DRAFT_1751428 [Mycena galopus ATCC 62051]